MAEKADKVYTFDEIEQHLKKADTDKLEKQASKLTAAASTPADILAQICPTYQSIRPILVNLTHIPFFPTSWKKAIKSFIRAMDMICPQT